MKNQTADIFIDIVDNYGDMGWVVEFITMSRLPYSWRIVTDDPEKMQGFLMKSGEISTHVEILDKKSHTPEDTASLVILGLHAAVDFARFPSGTRVIRVSYLTFDSWHAKNHKKEHLLSRPDRPIIELTYSPLPLTGGVWHYPKTSVTRSEWIESVGLEPIPEGAIWIPIFAYGETLHRLDLERIPHGVHLFFIGEIPDVIRRSKNFEHHTHLPWIPRAQFWDLIDLADLSILRGEISMLRGLMSGKPLIWDMYKGVGGWNKEEGEGFLRFIRASESYASHHEKINTGKVWNIEEALHLRDTWSDIPRGVIPNFQETLEKTLDSFGISL